MHVFCYLKNPSASSSLFHPKKLKKKIEKKNPSIFGHTLFWQKLKLLKKATKISYFFKIPFASTSL